jgi:hypothetical protein
MWAVTTRTAHRRATLLLYAAVQFVVLSAIAMRVFAGGTPRNPWAPRYDFWNNFLSELGATHTWAGRRNYASMVLFSIGLATIGVAMVAFARSWRAFAFARSRARGVGLASEYTCALSGSAFAALACSPVDKVLDLHNTLVVVAFGLLFVYAVSLTVVWALNGAAWLQIVSCVAYVAIVIVYFAVVLHAARLGIGTQRARTLLVGSQKIMAYASMLYVVYLTVMIRRIVGRG